MAKKVLYFIHSMCRSRVFKTFKEDPDLNQMMVGPKPVVFSGVPEDYRDFGIKNIKIYGSYKEAQNIINAFAPDVVVQTDMIKTVKFPAHSKKVFVMHGMIAEHNKNIFSVESCKHWRGFDLYCGATERFEEWVRYATGTNVEVMLNSLPQFDLFYKSNYKTLDRNVEMKKTKNPTAKKVILFCGFCCKDRDDYNQHNEDYFKTIAQLDKIARKNDWLIMVKPRQDYNKIKGFLVSGPAWGKQYLQQYAEVQKSRFTHFIHTDASIYNYFFADAIVCNGSSTVEIEACLAHKPLVLIRTQVAPNKYDPLGTVRCGAARYTNNLSNLEQVIVSEMKDPNIAEKDAFVANKGIIIDGLAHERVQNKIKKL